jgi:hypothetical protein
MTDKIKLYTDTDRYNLEIENSKLKFKYAEAMLEYIFQIVPKSEEHFNLYECLQNPTEYIRHYFSKVYEASIPGYVAKENAIDLSLYSLKKLQALNEQYKSIDSEHPMCSKGLNLKQTAIKLQDFDVYLPESKRVEFELVNTILDAATELTKLKTNYFDVRILAGSLHTKVENKVFAGEFTNVWEIKVDGWKE